MLRISVLLAQQGGGGEGTPLLLVLHASGYRNGKRKSHGTRGKGEGCVMPANNKAEAPHVRLISLWISAKREGGK